MTPHRTLIPALALLAGIPASAQTPVRVLHQDLRLDRFHLLAIDDAGVQLRDDDERTARVPLTALIALSAGGPDTLPAVPGEPSGMRVFVELVDAQRHRAQSLVVHRRGVVLFPGLQEPLPSEHSQVWRLLKARNAVKVSLHTPLPFGPLPARLRLALQVGKAHTASRRRASHCC